MAELEAVLKKDFMVKRSMMKGRIIKNENYKSRWFILTKNYLRYCDGTLQVYFIAQCRPVLSTVLDAYWFFITQDNVHT